MGADNESSDINFYRIDKTHLRHQGYFYGVFGIGTYPATRSANLHLSLMSKWRSEWEDVYGWTSRGFRLQNSFFVSFYDSLPYIDEEAEDYKSKATAATVRAIQGRYRESLADWIDAIKDPVAPHLGTDSDNLAAARKRIRWLRHHEYN